MGLSLVELLPPRHPIVRVLVVDLRVQSGVNNSIVVLNFRKVFDVVNLIVPLGDRDLSIADFSETQEFLPVHDHHEGGDHSEES